MLFCLSFSSLRIMMLAAFIVAMSFFFFSRKWWWQCVCVCRYFHKTNYFKTKGVWSFLPEGMTNSQKPHCQFLLFVCFGHCFHFPALIILILHVISGWQTSRLLKGGCLCSLIVIVMKPAKNHYKMLESSHTPRPHDSYFNYRSQISYVCFSYTKQHIDKLLFKCESHNFKRMSEGRMACILHGAQHYVLRSVDSNKGTIHTFLRTHYPPCSSWYARKTRAIT